MTKISLPLALAAALFTGAGAFAQAQAPVQVHDAWVRASVPQQKATGAFMELTASQDTRLVGASSPIAGVTEVHEMKMEGDVMKMRAVPGIDLPAGQSVALKPGGYHLMMMDLREAAVAGTSVPLTLVFEGRDGQRQTLEIQAGVRALGGAAAAAGHGHGMKH
ncbi:copper chaperone PCu(A)C [Comamonas faecalis]|uniref:Copper chaperone PCu(A)C n=1 Tax=Comamonas faecalis TaxID=1387849 RepID=A0ABP7QFY5_9BURK